jgi:uncharacterized protein YqjF (DUF2071 family)
MTTLDDPQTETGGCVERPLFLADWCDMFFIHIEAPPEKLQAHVPFPLDLFNGSAYISLVAFTQKHLRPAFGGRLAAALLAPLAEHEFLNLRTYVRVGDTRGIYFLSEWIPNRLAEWIGPRVYGLPYHLGQLKYRNGIRHFAGTVRGHGSIVQYAAHPGGSPQRASVGHLDHFLLERYSAFTHHHGITRRFDVEHRPWTFTPATIDTFIPDLLCETLPWIDPSRIAATEFSTGVQNVKIGRPQIVPTPRPVRALGALDPKRRTKT